MADSDRPWIEDMVFGVARYRATDSTPAEPFMGSYLPTPEEQADIDRRQAERQANNWRWELFCLSDWPETLQ